MAEMPSSYIEASLQKWANTPEPRPAAPCPHQWQPIETALKDGTHYWLLTQYGQLEGYYSETRKCWRAGNLFRPPTGCPHPHSQKEENNDDAAAQAQPN